MNKYQIAILSESHPNLDGLSAVDSIEWLRIEQEGAHSFNFFKDGALLSSVNLEMGSCDLDRLLGVIVVGSSDTFQALQDEWTSSFPAINLAFKHTPEWENGAILCAGIDCVSDVFKIQQSLSCRAALELSTYREEFDRLQRCFARLEGYVGNHSFARSTEIFGYPPDLDGTPNRERPTLSEGTNIELGGLGQYLPVDSLGLSSFSIYLGSKPESAGEPMSVRVSAMETGETLGAWLVDAMTTRLGWIELAFDQAIDRPALSLFIEVKFPEGQSEWALTLGPPHPYQEYCARTDSGQSLGAPIALRIFTNLPGVRVPVTTGVIRTTSAPLAQTQFVSYDAYGTAIQVVPKPQDGQPALVSYDPRIGILTVHPRVGGPTVAHIKVAVPKNAWGILAQISLAHEDANRTEFGVLVCAPGHEKKTLLKIEKLSGTSPFFSGWQSLSPLETRSISVAFAAVAERELSVYLLTRQAPESSPDFAWARFSQLRFLVLPSAVREKSKPNNPESLLSISASGSENHAIAVVEV